MIFGGEGPIENARRVSYIFDTKKGECHGFNVIPSKLNSLMFWLQTVRRGHNLYTLSKESSILKYNIATNSWVIVKIDIENRL